MVLQPAQGHIHIYGAAAGKGLLSIAKKIFGKQGDHYLTDIETGIIVTSHEVIDFSGISVTDVVTKAIEDAELFMRDGKFDSAFDRVHTAFHIIA